MPNDYHPLIPRRNPEDIDLGAIKADLSPDRTGLAAPDPQRASRQTALRDGRECRARHPVDRVFLAALPIGLSILVARIACSQRTWQAPPAPATTA